MKKKLVKLLSLSLASVMLVSLLGGCSKKGTDSNQGTNSGGNSTASTAKVEQNSLPIVKDKLTIKLLSTSRADFQYSNEMSVSKELEKRTNIHLEWQLLPVTDTAQKFNLIMASGDLPDMISYANTAALNKYGQQGAFIELTDSINKNAPNIKKMITNPPFPIPYINAEMKDSNGKIYAVPFLTAISTGQVFFLREDWLKNLNLKVPETTDELYTTLKAFKEKDPNKNGKADEIPFASRTGIAPLVNVMNSFGAHGTFYVAKDNTIKYGPMEDAFKDGLAYVNKLINEELIDKEFLTVNAQQFNAKVANNTVGMGMGWPFSSLAASNTAVKKLDPNYNYIALKPVKGPKGDCFFEGAQNNVLPRTVITSANKHPVETIKYLDYLFSEEGRMLMNWGVEGEHYKMVNGKPQFTDKILKNPEGKDVATARALAGMQQGLPTIATMDAEMAAAPDPEVAKAWQYYQSNNTLWRIFPNLPLDANQLSEVANKKTEVDTYITENVSKFMLGQTSLQDFPKYVDQIKKLGIDSILKTYNDAFKKYEANNK